jgi:hypothetical protein
MEHHMDPVDSFVMPNPPLADAKAYLERVMRETGLDLTGIARKAKVDPATLTRPYNRKGWKNRISITVLRKVAKATGVPMPTHMDPNPPEAEGVAEADIALELYEQLPSDGRPVTPEEKRNTVRRIVAFLKRRGLL